MAFKEGRRRMRIYTKKAFWFEQKNVTPVITKAMGFQEVPEWVKDTLLFRLALQDGSVQVLSTVKQQKELENDGMTEEEKEVREKAKALGIEKWQTTGLGTLKKKLKELEKETEENQQQENQQQENQQQENQQEERQ